MPKGLTVWLTESQAYGKRNNELGIRIPLGKQTCSLMLLAKNQLHSYNY